MAKIQNSKEAIKVIYSFFFFCQFLKVHSGGAWNDLALKGLLQ